MILGIGVDVIELDRVRGVLERHGERFTGRILTRGERAYCSRRADPVPSIAARFAAKEAVLKGLGTGLSRGIGWRDVEVARGRGGPPTVVLHRNARTLAEQAGVARVHLSLSHGRGIAVAVVVLER
jgi:holo-[acyl-carrier protein] synthase